MPHSIRGRIASDKEGPRYCSACHLTNEDMSTFGSDYASFLSASQTADYAAFDEPLLQQQTGKNPSNRLESPICAHQLAGLGSGLSLFD